LQIENIKNNKIVKKILFHGKNKRSKIKLLKKHYIREKVVFINLF